MTFHIDEINAAKISKFIPSDALVAIPGPAAADVLRLDEIHPVVSGNKWYKLKYNLERASQLGETHLLSCGGPHSNHLHALASAGQYFGFKVTAFVRGYKNIPLTPTLEDCAAMGMEIIFVDKKTYQNRYDPNWCQSQADYYQAYWIAEGGNNVQGQKGCAEIAQACLGYDEVWLSIGSGCTFSGVAQALKGHCFVHGVMAIKGGESLGQQLLAELDEPSKDYASIDYQSHLGGFGRCPQELIELINCHDALGLPLDPVYTGKLVMAFEKAWLQRQLDNNKCYLLIHSGGLQGRRGVKELSEYLP